MPSSECRQDEVISLASIFVRDGPRMVMQSPILSVKGDTLNVHTNASPHTGDSPCYPPTHLAFCIFISSHIQWRAHKPGETKERFCIADVFSGGAPVTAWRSHIAEGSLNAGILTALLHQCHADMLREDAMFAVMPEHSSSHCTTQPLWLKLSDSFHLLNIIIILFSSCVSIRGTLAI